MNRISKHTSSHPQKPQQTLLTELDSTTKSCKYVSALPRHPESSGPAKLRAVASLRVLVTSSMLPARDSRLFSRLCLSLPTVHSWRGSKTASVELHESPEAVDSRRLCPPEAPPERNRVSPLKMLDPERKSASLLKASLLADRVVFSGGRCCNVGSLDIGTSGKGLHRERWSEASDCAYGTMKALLFRWELTLAMFAASFWASFRRRAFSASSWATWCKCSVINRC
mmetsp:Transcript_35903/g.101067  ORF Transcript_35903/g.101067 Transcript_35903/m.101067 type:complete len:226 (+) Transcript_35903:1516-2193(+)